MDALDHCRTTRSSLKEKAANLKIGPDKLMIPEDGEVIILTRYIFLLLCLSYRLISEWFDKNDVYVKIK